MSIEEVILRAPVGEPSTLGNNSPGRAGSMGDLVATPLHGAMYHMAKAGRLYAFGISNTALVAANAIATGLTATAQPIIGIYNPIASGVNMVPRRVILPVTTIANTAVAPGGYHWVKSTLTAAVTTGSTPWNMKTLLANGSVGKAFAISTALTGLAPDLTYLRTVGITPGLNAAGPATAITQPQGNAYEDLDGSLFCPPGSVLAVMCQVATTTISMSPTLIWEEVPSTP